MNLQKRIRLKGIGSLILLMILGFLAGLSVENAAVTVLGILVLTYLSSRMDDRIDGLFLYPLITFGIGTILLIFSSGTSVRRNYYLSQGYDGDLSGAALYMNRFNRLGTDFIKLSWPLILIFFSCLFIYIIVVLYRNHQNKNTKFNKLRGLSIFDLSFFYVASLISVFLLILIAYQSDQQRGFALFWLISISLIAYLVSRIFLIINSKLLLVFVIIGMVLILGFEMIEIGNIYSQFAVENNNRLNIIHSGLTLGKKEVVLPAILTRDSRLIETREILPDLGERFAIYYDFDSVTFEK